MIIKMHISNNRITSFEGRRPNLPMHLMNETLTPMVERLTPIKEMESQSNFTRAIIDRWSRIKYGMTIAHLYRMKQNEMIKDEFIEHRKKRNLYI